MLLALLDVVVEDVPKVVPAALRDQDGVAEVSLDLGHRDVPWHCEMLVNFRLVVGRISFFKILSLIPKNILAIEGICNPKFNPEKESMDIR